MGPIGAEMGAIACDQMRRSGPDGSKQQRPVLQGEVHRAGEGYVWLGHYRQRSKEPLEELALLGRVKVAPRLCNSLAGTQKLNAARCHDRP